MISDFSFWIGCWFMELVTLLIYWPWEPLPLWTCRSKSPYCTGGIEATDSWHLGRTNCCPNFSFSLCVILVTVESPRIVNDLVSPFGAYAGYAGWKVLGGAVVGGYLDFSGVLGAKLKVMAWLKCWFAVEPKRSFLGSSYMATNGRISGNCWFGSSCCKPLLCCCYCCAAARISYIFREYFLWNFT